MFDAKDVVVVSAAAILVDLALIFVFGITIQFWFISIWKIGIVGLAVGGIIWIIDLIPAATPSNKIRARGELRYIEVSRFAVRAGENEEDVVRKIRDGTYNGKLIEGV